jgi:hypothetical protein
MIIVEKEATTPRKLSTSYCNFSRVLIMGCSSTCTTHDKVLNGYCEFHLKISANKKMDWNESLTKIA